MLVTVSPGAVMSCVVVKTFKRDTRLVDALTRILDGRGLERVDVTRLYLHVHVDDDHHAIV